MNVFYFCFDFFPGFPKKALTFTILRGCFNVLKFLRIKDFDSPEQLVVVGAVTSMEISNLKGRKKINVPF